MSNDYSETSGELARKAGTTTQTVCRYADMGELDFLRLSNGTRVFRAGQEGRVREILEARLAGRGRKKS